MKKTITMDIPVPLEIFMALCRHREQTGCKEEIWQMAGAAMRDWLQLQQQLASASCNGYQWKNLFLPHGTLLRSVIKGQSFHASVSGDCVMFEGKRVSPSGFVNAHGGAARNAWKAIWLLFPGHARWRLAANCRPAAPARRRMEGVTGQAG
jgi:hypothetical protein